MAISMAPTDSDEDRVLAEINTTPLVDVMLVLLIIFLITIPVVTTSIKLELPKETNQPRQTAPTNIIISVDKTGTIYWYDSPMPSVNALVARLKKAAQTEPQPEVQIRGDLAASYEPVGRVVHAVQGAGIVKVSFVTEPSAPAGR